MRRVNLMVLAAVGIIAAAAPALAQPYRGGPRERGPDRSERNYDIAGRIDWMQRRIDRGRGNGSLDRREAYRVQQQLDDIRHDMRRTMRRNGGYLTPSDRAFLQRRLDRLNDQIHWLRRNDDGDRRY